MSPLNARRLWRLRYLEWRLRAAADEVGLRREGLARAEENLAKQSAAVAAARQEIALAVSS